LVSTLSEILLINLNSVKEVSSNTTNKLVSILSQNLDLNVLCLALASRAGSKCLKNPKLTSIFAFGLEGGDKGNSFFFSSCSVGGTLDNAIFPM
jgi:hypothetical protein